MLKRHFALVGAAALAVGQMASAATPYIGINFTGGGGPNGATSVAAGDSAGLVPQANYNNVDGASGTTGPLNDAAGASTPVTLTFAGAGTWGTGLGTGSADQRLLSGYVDGTDNGTNTFTLNNVPAGTYNLIIYSTPDGLDGRDEHFVLNGNAASPVYLSADSGANFNNVGFLRATATAKDGAGATGNYVQFDNITLGAAGSIAFTSTSDTFRNFENGIQLVKADVPEPTTLGALALGGAAMLLRRRRLA